MASQRVPVALVLCAGLAAGCGSLGRPEGSGGAPRSSPGEEEPGDSSSRSTASAGTGSRTTQGRPSAQPAPTTTSTPSTPSTPTTFPDAVRQVRDGVARLEVATCDGYGHGSGFLLGPRHVATVAHVVEDAAVVRVVLGTTSTAGTVVGLDRNRDLALVKTATPLSGHLFSWSRQDAQEGAEVSALGFPGDRPLTTTTGTVNGLERRSVIAGVTRYGLFEHNADTNPGSSGGPLIQVDGSVVGLVHAGPLLTVTGRQATVPQGGNLAVPADVARVRMNNWQTVPDPPMPADCDDGVDLDGEPLAFDNSDDVVQAVHTLRIHHESINNADADTALAQFVRPGNARTFSEGVRSSQNSDWELRKVVRGEDSIVVWLTFRSRQEPSLGPRERPSETCTDWSLDYTLTPARGLWLVSDVEPHEGVPRNAPCDELPLPPEEQEPPAGGGGTPSPAAQGHTP